MRATLPALALAAGATAFEVARRSDRRRIESDPEWALLRDRPRGRVVPVRAADGTALHVEVLGPEDAPPIVLAHGWTCATRFWVRQLRDLSGEFRVIAYDQRGHGRSEAPASRDFSLPTLAGDLRAVLDATLADGEDTVLAGHSLGAMTAVAYGDRYGTQSLSAVALVNTGMGDLVGEALLLRMPGPLGATRKMVGRALLGAAAPLPPISTPIGVRAIGAITCGPDATLAQRAFCERLVLRCGPSVRAGVGREISRMDLHEAIANLDVPALVIAGTHDALTPLPLARRLAAELPQLVDLLELPTGHMGPIESPDAVTAAIRELARVPVAA